MKIKSIPPHTVHPAMSYGVLVGQVINRHRTARRIDQVQIADALGITQSAYSRIEKGQSGASIAQLRTICGQFGYAPNTILHEADELALQLARQGVEIKDKQEITPAQVLVGLGILTALFAMSKS